MGFRFTEKKKKRKEYIKVESGRGKTADTNICSLQMHMRIWTYTHTDTHPSVHTQSCKTMGFLMKFIHKCALIILTPNYLLSPIPRWSLSIFNNLKELLCSFPSKYLFIAPMVCNDSLFHIPKAPLGMSCLYISHSHLFGWDIVVLLSFLDV